MTIFNERYFENYFRQLGLEYDSVIPTSSHAWIIYGWKNKKFDLNIFCDKSGKILFSVSPCGAFDGVEFDTLEAAMVYYEYVS